MRFLKAAGILSIVMMADDLFMLHESAGDFVDGAENGLLVGYGVTLLWILIRFRDVIRRTDSLILLAALLFLGLSAAVDLMQPLVQRRIGEWRILIEDGAKFVGIACWSSYLVLTCKKVVVNSHTFA
ncbi:MAG: hypothetical protein KJO98_01305 [Rhodothermia bacterium]|nr:hypothetical protein [Rhodothermia bacterium]